jgi:hypothetical protein|nr:MAG: hypothetical protein [Bacteriophage sp.]
MRAITEKQEKELDTREQTTLDNGFTVSRKSIYIYGEVDFTSEEDIAAIKKLHLIDDSDKGNPIPSGFSYLTGEVEFEDNIKYRPTWDEFEWFKYNYCLIGKPQRIVIHECDKSSL